MMGHRILFPERRPAMNLAIFPVTLLALTAIDTWNPQTSGTTERLRGVSVVSDKIAWASGAKGTILRTIDGGASWTPQSVPNAEDLDFRDIHAVDARVAYALSIGEAEKSRIYKTTDGGESWTLQHTNRDPKGFLDAIAFWDADHGVALGDPVEGRYMILTTDDAGKTWTPIKPEGMPLALPGEGAFAASGTCLIVGKDDNVWFGTGGAKSARVFRSTDRGRTWSAHETPIRAGAATSGIFSVAFRDANHGVIVGGAYDQADRKGQIAATTDDGGMTWNLVTESEPNGFRSAAAFIEDGNTPRLVAVGPSGTDLSTDLGRSWKPLGTTGFHAVGFAGNGVGWGVGENGRISLIRVR